jgi:pyruvate/2-oxoglutarate dehydrogenase complex dihydrolipoamide dehydrogenase (E3) component
MKKKLLIVGALFISLVVGQVFTSGHSHVVVVEDNIQLIGENKKLTKSVNKLKAENQELTEDKENLEQMVSEVIGDLDSTRSVVKDIKKELQNEKDIVRKQSTGTEFDFQPITLPTSDGN